MKCILLVLILFGTTFGDQSYLWGFGIKFAKPGQFPFMAIIKSCKRKYCSGAIIGARWVLTSAQCTLDLTKKSIVRVGTTSQCCLKKGTKHRIAKWITHEHYDESFWNTFKNNVGLIQIKDRFKYTKFVQPVGLGSAFTDDTVVAIGWRSIEFQFHSKDPTLCYMLYEDHTVISLKECQNFYEKLGNEVTTKEICTELTSFARCHGDWGGPIISEDGKLVGIGMDHGSDCGGKVPGVRPRPPPYLCWIANHTGISPEELLRGHKNETINAFY